MEIYAGGKVHLVREPLAKLTAQLDAGEFIRVHRSHVVRLASIAELQPMFHGDYELILRNGERLGAQSSVQGTIAAGDPRTVVILPERSEDKLKARCVWPAPPRCPRSCSCQA